MVKGARHSIKESFNQLSVKAIRARIKDTTTPDEIKEFQQAITESSLSKQDKQVLLQ